MKSLALALCSGTLSSALFAQTAVELTTPEVFRSADGASLLYRLHRPVGLADDARVPLILFLHGAGERGNDNAAQLKHGVTDLIRFSQTNGHAFLLAPQCPAGMQWANVPWNAERHTMTAEPAEPLRLTLALLDEALARWPIDPRRVYVTGISMGGYGTWDLLQRYPERFAAGLPICGGGDEQQAVRLKAVPVWTFHGDQDRAVPVQRTRNMVQALEACGGLIRYREFPGAGHDVWTRTYADPAVLAWLFAQRRPAAASGHDVSAARKSPVAA